MLPAESHNIKICTTNRTIFLLIGAPAGKRIILFVDDLNMPKLDTYGSQPPIELLRQYQVSSYLLFTASLILNVASLLR